jgi:hypothetical protein
VVFGGEAISNVDLEDIWAFDLEAEKWIRLLPGGKNPSPRRFTGSALVGSDFYLIGGCHDNYEQIGEMHRLSLLPLKEGKPQSL